MEGIVVCDVEGMCSLDVDDCGGYWDRGSESVVLCYFGGGEMLDSLKIG